MRKATLRTFTNVNYGLIRRGWPFESILTIQFRYNIQNGRATYLLACQDEEVQYHIRLLKQNLNRSKNDLHPFVIHLVLFYQPVKRGEIIEDSLRDLLKIEKEHFSSDDWTVTSQNASETKDRLKDLHRLFRNIIIQENHCKRPIRDPEEIAKRV